MESLLLTSTSNKVSKALTYLILKARKACNCKGLVIFIGCIQKQHQRYSIKKGVRKNFAKFTGKHLCQSLFFSKVAGLRLATLLK